MSDNDIYDLDKYPQDIRPIIEILLEYEEELSDGYDYYLPPYWDNGRELVCVGKKTYLELIAREIMEVAKRLLCGD